MVNFIERRATRSCSYFSYSFINIFTCNVKPYHLTICLREDEMDNYKKYKWKKPILSIGSDKNKVDIILSFNYKEC
jgi:hypothetical protein